MINEWDKNAALNSDIFRLHPEVLLSLLCYKQSMNLILRVVPTTILLLHDIT